MNFQELLHILIHSTIDTIKIIPFLFITYMIIELLERTSSATVNTVITKSGMFGPVVGSILGTIPQCGLSSVAANLFGGGIITVGTLVAVFLSTSDEMIPVLIGSNISSRVIIGIVVYKVFIGIIVGVILDIVLNFIGTFKHPLQIESFCKSNDCNCHCEHHEHGHPVRGALQHTVSVTIFILIVTTVINLVIHIVGEDTIAQFISQYSIFGYVVAPIIGLIPNCSGSVLLTTLFTEHIISLGMLICGLLTGAGIGSLVLFKVHKHHKENILVILLLLIVGVLFGCLADTTLINSIIVGG